MGAGLAHLLSDAPLAINSVEDAHRAEPAGPRGLSPDGQGTSGLLLGFSIRTARPGRPVSLKFQVRVPWSAQAERVPTPRIRHQHPGKTLPLASRSPTWICGEH